MKLTYDYLHMTSNVDRADVQSIWMLKIRLLSLGLAITGPTREFLAAHSRMPKRVRSGASGGLDVVLPCGIWVNCPTNERFADSSPLLLRLDKDRFTIFDSELGQEIPVEVMPNPAYTGQLTSHGVPMGLIAQISGDRLGIGIMSNCYFWNNAELRCKFCSIGFNVNNELPQKGTQQILETVDAAFSDPVRPARHLLLSTGTTEEPDRGAMIVAEVAKEIRKRYDFPIYAMVAAPRDLTYIEVLKDSGIDELGMNLEVYDNTVASSVIPGKYRLIGTECYLEALEYAVNVFGPINTRSVLIAGLGEPASTVRGALHLASLGVMPIICPLRPLSGTDFEHTRPPDATTLMRVCVDAQQAISQYQMPLGPTCIPCQNNCLTVPEHPAYRYY